MVFQWFCVRLSFNMWFLKIIQVTMKYDPIDVIEGLKVSWDNNTWELLHNKCRYKSYHNDIKYHVT